MKREWSIDGCTHIRMNIGIVTYDYDPPIGGLGKSVALATRTLMRLYRSDSFVIIAPSPHGNGMPSLALWTWKRRGGCPLFSCVLSFNLENIIRKYELDTLLVHSGSGGVFLLRKPSRPLIVVAHHTYKQEARHVFNESRLKALRKKAMALLEKRTYALADCIICVSNDTRAELIERYNVPPSKITVVENAIDQQWFLKEQCVQRRPDSISYLGRLEERKGIWVLLEAYRTLLLTHPHVRLRLVGENLLGPSLHRFIEKHKLETMIDIVSAKSDAAFVREMSSAEIVVVPSLVEGFGLTVAEAMAVGAFVIASDCEGLRGIISHRRTGLLFESGRSEACASAIREALSSQELRSTCQSAAMREARERFDAERQAKTLYDYLRAHSAKIPPSIESRKDQVH